MNKKFLSAILFGALMVTSTGTFVSCKDYDDDIDSINKELVDLKSAVAALQSKVDAGKYVTNVAKNGEGITVTWNDGTSSTIETIKGEDGEAVAITIDPTTKNWLVDGVDTGVCAEGKNAETPIFSIGEDGHIYVQYGEEEKEDLGVSTGGIYIVEDGPKVTLHVPDADGNFSDIVLPKTAAITEIKALTIGTTYGRWTTVGGIDYYFEAYMPNKVSEGAFLNLVYGKAAANGKYFDGTEFAKGELLTSQQSITKLSAQVNPTMADASLYDFYLTDSKGNEFLTLTKAEANKTEGALTRAEATANKGVYDMGVTFAAETTVEQVESFYKMVPYLNEAGKQMANAWASDYKAFAIATKDAFGNEILSGYDVRVYASTGSSYIYQKKEAIVEVGSLLNLNSVLEMYNIIDVKYSISKDQTAKKDALGVVLNGGIISAEKEGYIDVTVDWMDCNGVRTDADNNNNEVIVRVTFESVKNTGALNVEWTVGEKTNNAYSKALNVNAYTDNAAAASNTAFDITGNITYINADGDETVAPTGAITAEFTSTDADANGDVDGYYNRVLTYTFDPELIIPTTYTHEIPYGDNDKLTVTIVVKEPANYFNFQVLDAYFNADKTEAVAYGTPNGSTIDYDLYDLFTNATKAESDYITFSEVVPATYKNADNADVVARPWLNGTDVTDDDIEWIADDDIVVDKADLEASLVFGGAYYARAITAKYQPYGNAYLTPAKMTFNLTIKSDIFEGTLEYVKATYKTVNNRAVFDKYVAGDIKEIDGGNTATLSLSEILGKDVYGKSYNNQSLSTPVSMLDDDRIASVDVVLADDNAKEYLSLSGAVTSGDNAGNVIGWNGGAITISKKSANTAIVTPPTCTVRVKVTDKWNKVKTVDVQVKVVK